MKDIFAELYNKVIKFFNKTEEKSENAKDVACNRLKLVLMQDRTNLSPAIMDRMRSELIELLSKYMELDRELLDLNFEHEDEQMALMLSIPVIRAKTEDEIQAILDKEDAEKKAKEDAQTDEDSDEDEEAEFEDETSEEEDNDENEEDNDKDEDNDEESEDDDEDEEDDDEDDDEDEEIEEEPVTTKAKKEKFFKKKEKEITEDDDE